jgi:hypothetical protein
MPNTPHASRTLPRSKQRPGVWLGAAFAALDYLGTSSARTGARPEEKAVIPSATRQAPGHTADHLSGQIR